MYEKILLFKEPLYICDVDDDSGSGRRSSRGGAIVRVYNKTAERENRKFSTWKRYVLLNNAKFFDIYE